MEILLVIVGAAALVWGSIVFLRGGLLGGSLAVLLAGTAFGSYFYSVPLGLAPVTIDRLLWGLLMVQAVLWRRWGANDPKPLGKPEILLGLFAAVLLMSTLTHDWHAHNSAPLARFLFFYLMPLGMYWVARQTPITERGMACVLGFFALLGLYLAVTAVAEMKQIWWLVYPQYIGSTEYAEFFGRGRGPLLNPPGNGILMGLGMVSMLLWWPRMNRPGRLLLLAVSVVFLAGIYSTLTRCAWIGAGLGLLTLLGLTLPKSWRVPVLASTIVAVTLVVATQWERLLAFKRDEAATAQDTAESVKLRPILARVAWNMFLDRPLLGCGFGQYMDQSIYYLQDRSTELVLEKARPYCQHNVFFSLLTETGLVGMGLFVVLLLLWTRDAWRLWRCSTAPFWARQQGLLLLALLGNYLANGLFHDVSLIAMVNMVLFFLAGLTRGLLASVEETTGAATDQGPVKGDRHGYAA
jgi:O-antigen ligase